MSATVEAYDPSSNISRATLFLVIVAIHVAALAILATARHIAIAIQRDPIIVKVIPEPPRPRTPPPPTVPLPPLVKPEVRLLSPPPVENLYMVQVVEEKRPPAPQPVAAIVSPNPAPAPPVVEAPRFDMAYLNNPAPSYPPASRRTREEGRVMLRVLVNAGGTVESIEVQKTSGFARLDEAAVAAVRRWRFHPARSGERPIEGYAIVPVSFRLS